MLNQSERLQLPVVHSFGCHRTMSGRAFSIWKVQLRKAAQSCRQRRSYHSQQLAQQTRSLATAEPHAEVAQTAPSSTADAVDTFLSGLHFEAKKGFRNLQGRERFADFAARHTRHLLIGKESEPLSDIVEAFQMYEALSIRDRKAVVDKAIQEVHAMTAGPSAQSTGAGIKQGDSAAGSELLRASTASLSHGAQPSAEQQASAQVSQRNRGIRLMTAEGALSAAPLLSSADLAAASSEPRQGPSANTMQPGPHAAALQVAAMRRSHAGSRSMEASSSATFPSAAEQALSRSATAVLVGEDEEFSVSADVNAGLSESAASPAVADDVGRGRRIIKPETAAFRASFTQAAAAAASTSLGRSRRKGKELGQGEQRTAEWHAEREHRLTASAFGNALGFWPEGRQRLWEEKLHLRRAFAGNAATQWGTVQEDVALSCYTEVTGHLIKPCRFAVLRDDEVHGWLGASPDGLIDSLSAHPASPGALAAGMGPGVLEIKCPFNRGQPESASVPSLPPWYYMPQVQGLMEIFQREWCNIYLWTVNGSAMFHISRDRQYWNACFEVLSEFWWAHLVPAKHAIASNRREDAYRFMPSHSHNLTAELSKWSKTMAKAAPASMYPPSQPILK